MPVTTSYCIKNNVLYQREGACGLQPPQLLFITLAKPIFFCPLQIYNYLLLVKYFCVVHPHLAEYLLNVWHSKENGNIYSPKVSFGNFAKWRFNE